MTLNEILLSIEQLGELEGVDLFVIGYSTFNRPIYAMHVGKYESKQILMEGGIHAREYLSTLFLIEEVKYLQEQFELGNIDGGYYIVPLVNPDGVGLVLDGILSVECDKQQEIIIAINDGSTDFDLWKASGTGVDLNVNFNALWGQGSQNVFCPASGNFVGFYPNSEREVRVLINFAQNIAPDITISWHTKGEVIYYGFASLTQEQLQRDKYIADQLSKINGYPVIRTEGSVGGFQDWVSKNLQVPAYTFELGNFAVPHPLGIENLPLAFGQNKQIPIEALKLVEFDID